MGIYPNRRTEDHQPSSFGGESWVEVETEPGIVRKRYVYAHQWVEKRTDCYCCSCGDEAGLDPACRNHGFAAKRPCEVHGMPGSLWDDDLPGSGGTMPESVQAHNRRRRGLLT